MRVLRLLVSRHWLWRHALMLLAVCLCYGFGRWQFGRAVRRHSILNWSYTVEWTLFGCFAVLCWGWFLRDELRGVDVEAIPEPVAEVYLPVASVITDEEDPDLAAYNRYLADLNAKGNR